MYKRQVYCEVKPYTTPLADIRAMNPIGIIFTGGPNSVYDPKSPQVDPAIFTLSLIHIFVIASFLHLTGN